MQQVVADIGEAGVIARIAAAAALRWPAPGGMLVGIGDDAAVLALAGACVLATDSVVEGVHFRREWVDPHAIGRKVAARNFADIAAMGARPRALLLALTLPPQTPLSWLDSFIAGIIDECARAGAQLAGGDITAGPVVMAVGTAVGELAGRSITRSGARVGDTVAVSGACGAAAAGLAVLSAGLTAPEDAVAAYASPTPDYDAAARAAAGGASAMIDCSDGLVNDLRHIASASGCDMRIVASAVPVSAAATAAAATLGADALAWALTGGEDHVFIATFPAGVAVADGFTAVGEALPGGGGVWVDATRWPDAGGYQHFTDVQPTPPA